MFPLIANGARLIPTAGAPTGEWAVWGACMSAAAVLGGWCVVNRNHPSRGLAVRIALIGALALVGKAMSVAEERSRARAVEPGRPARTPDGPAP